MYLDLYGESGQLPDLILRPPLVLPSGTLPGSTTDANVYLNLYGESGQLPDLILRPPLLLPSGTLPGSTTDANVYLDLYGESGQLQDLILRDTGDLFNAGQEDTFFFPNPGLGAIGSAVISHDDSGESVGSEKGRGG